MKDGNINDATINANVPATIVDPYAIPVVTPNNFPAPVARSAIPAVTNPIIIKYILYKRGYNYKNLRLPLTYIKEYDQRIVDELLGFEE